MSQATARAPWGSRAAPSHGRAGGTESHLQTDPGSSTHSVWTAHAGRGNLTSLLLLWVLMAKVGALTHRTPPWHPPGHGTRRGGPRKPSADSGFLKGPVGKDKAPSCPLPQRLQPENRDSPATGRCQGGVGAAGGSPPPPTPPTLPSPTGHRARGAPRAGRARFQRRSPLEGRFGHEGKEGGEFQGAWGRVWGVEGRQSQVGLRNE